MWLQPRYMDMANILINESKPFWEKYVIFEKTMTSIEISILFIIAGHFYKLDFLILKIIEYKFLNILIKKTGAKYRKNNL